MQIQRAILIQDVSEFLAMIKKPLWALVREEHILAGLAYDDLVQWIIEEELELNYGLYARAHIHNRWPHCLLHSQLDASLPMALHRYTQHYIKAPLLYGDNVQVDVRLTERDLYIEYRRPLGAPSEY